MFNEDSHGASPEKALRSGIDPETISVAKKVIDKLKENADQYNALLQSIGISV
jgi:fatty acid/phospholipid biosynthesis enzyme